MIDVPLCPLQQRVHCAIDDEGTVTVSFAEPVNLLEMAAFEFCDGTLNKCPRRACCQCGSKLARHAHADGNLVLRVFQCLVIFAPAQQTPRVNMLALYFRDTAMVPGSVKVMGWKIFSNPAKLQDCIGIPDCRPMLLTTVGSLPQ